MIDNCVCYQDYIAELEDICAVVAKKETEIEHLRERETHLREALKLILSGNSLPYAQEIAAKALEEKK